MTSYMDILYVVRAFYVAVLLLHRLQIFVELSVFIFIYFMNCTLLHTHHYVILHECLEFPDIFYMVVWCLNIVCVLFICKCLLWLVRGILPVDTKLVEILCVCLYMFVCLFVFTVYMTLADCVCCICLFQCVLCLSCIFTVSWFWVYCTF